MVFQENELMLNCIDDYTIEADEDCNYLVPDFAQILIYNPESAAISQSIDAGNILNAETDITVTAILDGESQSCTISLVFDDNIAPTLNCPGEQIIQANNGSPVPIPDFTDLAEAEDNCGVVQVSQTPAPDSMVSNDTMITITASDAAGNSTDCSFNLQIVSGNEPSISCPSDKTVAINDECTFIMPDYTSDAQVSNGDGLEVTQQPAPGTEIASSQVEVTLNLINGNNSRSCSFMVFPEDQTPPVLQLQDLTVNLDADATAIISFEDLDNGSFDACDENVTYTISKERFTCKEIGSNRVEVVATDTSGNTTSATVTVNVTDTNLVCEIPPFEEIEYVYIYPNPNVGSFKVSTPTGVSIERIEVFDHRGRFIAAKDFEAGDLEYAMDVGPLQEAVYVLKIITNEETLTRRMIFKY